LRDSVLLTGSDCTAMTTADLAAAATALDEARLAFIPAEDGGYVLVGARRGGLERGCFRDVPWGSAEVMAQTRSRLVAHGWTAGRDRREMPALWDVATPADFERMLLEAIGRD
jgi:glycosyltransferase A (GT-A) superfamily protein (DUF2064 family)